MDKVQKTIGSQLKGMFPFLVLLEPTFSTFILYTKLTEF
jgi:hypothetical protein